MLLKLTVGVIDILTSSKTYLLSGLLIHKDPPQKTYSVKRGVNVSGRGETRAESRPVVC